MTRLIRIKVGDAIPKNAKFIGTELRKEYSHTDYDYGIFFIDRTTYYKTVTYCIYEVKNENDTDPAV